MKNDKTTPKVSSGAATNSAANKYGVKIPDEDLAGLRTVGDVVGYIQKLEEENPEAAAALREKFGSE